jgi:hypothetical protein
MAYYGVRWGATGGRDMIHPLGLSGHCTASCHARRLAWKLERYKLEKEARRAQRAADGPLNEMLQRLLADATHRSEWPFAADWGGGEIVASIPFESVPV